MEKWDQQNNNVRRDGTEAAALIVIPESEMKEKFTTSGGPGGQNVNKVASRVTLTWDFLSSDVLSDEQKLIISDKLGNNINAEGCLFVRSRETRDQLKNRRIAKKRLADMVNAALTPEKERKATAVPKKAKERRLDAKKRQSGKKTERRFNPKDW